MSFVHLINLLLAGIPRAGAIALVAVEREGGPVQVLHWDSRSSLTVEFQPSHAGARCPAASTGHHSARLGEWGGFLARAIPCRGISTGPFALRCAGEACKGWGIYVTGRSTADSAATLLRPGRPMSCAMT